jgi:hypothetical protein
VLEQEGEQIALLIDGIAGQQQVVLKSLEENFVRVHGFAGRHDFWAMGASRSFWMCPDLIRRGRQSAERYAAVALNTRREDCAMANNHSANRNDDPLRR